MRQVANLIWVPEFRRARALTRGGVRGDGGVLVPWCAVWGFLTRNFAYVVLTLVAVALVAAFLGWYFDPMRTRPAMVEITWFRNWPPGTGRITNISKEALTDVTLHGFRPRRAEALRDDRSPMPIYLYLHDLRPGGSEDFSFGTYMLADVWAVRPGQVSAERIPRRERTE